MAIGQDRFAFLESPTLEPGTQTVNPHVLGLKIANAPSGTGVYYNPRLDPKLFLDGPLSVNPATRLRQMLARPGIVVSIE